MLDIRMTFSRWAKDASGKICGDVPEYRHVRGSNDFEINAMVQELRMTNDVVKFTPWSFVSLDSVEVV